MLQDRAVSANCFDILKRTLDELPSLAQLANHTRIANDQDDEIRTVSRYSISIRGVELISSLLQ